MKKEDLIAMGLTEEQADKVLAENGKSINKLKTQLANKDIEINELKDKADELDTIKQSQLTDEQKLQEALDAAKENEIKFKKQLSKLEAEKILVNAGLKEDDYKDFIDNVINEDLDITRNIANGFANVISAKIEATEARVKENILKDMPRPPAGNEDETDETTAFVKELVHTSKEADTSVYE